MTITHFYESTVVDDESDFSGTFLVVPSRCMPDGVFVDEPIAFAQALGFQPRSVIRPGWTIRAIASLVANKGDGYFLESWGSPDPHIPQAQQPQNRHYRFAEYVTMAPIVPFENSPLGGASLGDIITRASGVGLGAYVGFVVADGTALVYVLVPAGMVLFGASAGLARGLEEGIRERVKRWISGKRR